MKPTHKLLFILCPILVLGFIYYSSWKLHYYIWVQRPQIDAEEATVVLTNAADVKGMTEMEIDIGVGRIVGSGTSAAHPAKPLPVIVFPPHHFRENVYDKQGFLVQLDTQLSQDLLYKYGNLSEGACKPGYAAAKMASIYPKFMKLAPMFLDPNFKRLGKVSSYMPPFGFKTQEKLIDSILRETKSYGLGEHLDSLSCKRCIIVGNGGILSNKSLGSRIDQYDVVIRLNEAPVKGYSKDVGSKTTMRITYPEGAIQKPENYEDNSLFVFSAFKPLDFKWLKQMVYKEKRGMEGFWKSVAQYVPREASDMRILNPYFIQEAAFQFIGLPFNNGLMGKGNIPTLGTVAITMALHNCDEVAVAGFGYDMNMPYAPLHYYETVRMSTIKESWTHNIPKEKEFLRKLVKANVITDLTNGI
ncbi:ST3 beta-galactoside alpha-2,3-sialyltransferase 3b isoform X2 [Oryzias melastigma]|uniref:ST3 beta-galactoside alpha-2,3-sialyltransferase 3b isoform X2 n=1 Tax=Oryzias melastigma TaxID=30732 RepID=UPI000CF7EF5D|nr:ST3 beta-galactoside alpha-2,3-sialyltransferase 3b isoform X2 [Oryzias melastigma]